MGEASYRLISSERAKMKSDKTILHYNQHRHEEVETAVGCGGQGHCRHHCRRSCPNNLIEDAIRRLFELRGISVRQLLET